MASIRLISFIINIPKQYYELKLLKHLRNIDIDNVVDNIKEIDKLNTELENLMKSLSTSFKYSWIELILGTLIIIMSLWQMIFYNPYWIYMKLPILMFYGIVLLKFIYLSSKLKNNMNKFTKHSS
tara:strand:- start:540 stop:914 length:375 start_codon:yes stop_codon:yes gene_type:complete